MSTNSIHRFQLWMLFMVLVKGGAIYLNCVMCRFVNNSALTRCCSSKTLKLRAHSSEIILLARISPAFISTHIVSLQGYATWWNVFQLRNMSCTTHRSVQRLMKSRDRTRFIIVRPCQFTYGSSIKLWVLCFRVYVLGKILKCTCDMKRSFVWAWLTDASDDMPPDCSATSLYKTVSVFLIGWMLPWRNNARGSCRTDRKQGGGETVSTLRFH